MIVDKIINKMERKIGKYAVHNLMLYIVISMGAVYALIFLNPQYKILSYLNFDRALILKGQVWRLISFIVFPDIENIIFFAISLYLYWMFGRNLENYWGKFKFNLFYFTGVILTIIGGFITGYASNMYLNLSLFLAFAFIFPNQVFRIYFVIPIKVIHLAYIYIGITIISFISGSFIAKITILMSFLNLAIFFSDKLYFWFNNKLKYRKARGNFRKHYIHHHKNNNND